MIKLVSNRGRGFVAVCGLCIGLASYAGGTVGWNEVQNHLCDAADARIELMDRCTDMTTCRATASELARFKKDLVTSSQCHPDESVNEVMSRYEWDWE